MFVTPTARRASIMSSYVIINWRRRGLFKVIAMFCFCFRIIHVNAATTNFKSPCEVAYNISTSNHQHIECSPKRSCSEMKISRIVYTYPGELQCSIERQWVQQAQRKKNISNTKFASCLTIRWMVQRNTRQTLCDDQRCFPPA